MKKNVNPGMAPPFSFEARMARMGNHVVVFLGKATGLFG